MPTKKTAKKTTTRKNATSVRTQKGKAAVKKGIQFEQDVAELYRLLGAEVTQNIEISHKKVDILATFTIPGSITKHRVIVECKDEKNRVADNQRVMQFKGLLEVARKLGIAESAEIITRVPWSDAAKGFAREHNIGLFTYSEKISQLIDFKPYLQSLIERFRVMDDMRPNDPPLAEYYVSSSAEKITEAGTEDITSIDTYLQHWVEANKQHEHIAVLGEYGTGKTSLCQKLAHDLAISYLESPGRNRIPILFNLREFTKRIDIESFVTSFLDKECGVVNPRYRLFNLMNAAGIILLIFDAFDEMAVRVDSDTLEVNLQEIDKLAVHPNSKVLITSRVEYFTSTEEEEKALRPKGTILETRKTQYQPLRLNVWDDEQVDSFLEKRVPLIEGCTKPWTYYSEQIAEIPGLSDLSRRPVLLDMIVKTLPELIAVGKPINRPNLYETYLLGEIRRQKISKRRELLLSENERFLVLQQLALDFYTGKIPAITFSEGMNRICETINPPKIEVEAYTREFLSCSFLSRQSDEYRFSHNSIMEYLVAKALVQRIAINDKGIMGAKLLQPVVASFMAELNPDVNVLRQWIKSTKKRVTEDLKYIGGNSVTLLCLMSRDALVGMDLSVTALLGADFSGANLLNTKLNGSFMSDVSLCHADFLRESLAETTLSNFRVAFYVLGDAKETKPSKRKDVIDSVFRKLGEFYQLERNLYIEIGYCMAEYRNFFLLYFDARIPDESILPLIEQETLSQKWVRSFSIYYNQKEELFRICPKNFKDAIERQRQHNLLFRRFADYD